MFRAEPGSGRPPAWPAVALWAAVAIGAAQARTPIFKCLIDGTVTYQQDPCPAGEKGPRPTAAQINEAERANRARRAVSATPAEAAARPSPPPVLAARPDPPPAARQANAPRFRCDGRRFCSQMTSCAEAKYFLAHCPDTRMDGDGDGIPCEDQWCGH